MASAEFAHLVKELSAKQIGSSWMARCPAHPDRNPSLALSESNGKILFHDHGGCSQAAVLRALKDLGIWQAKPKDRAPVGQRIVATYDYTDERGRLLYQIVRYEPKAFSARCPDGRGGWVNKKHQRPVLYRLPEVLESPIVFLVEGEKDVETLRSRGFVATTNAFGASQPWLPQYTAALAGREVILIPDADLAGRQSAIRKARALLGQVSRLIIWEPEGAKDITEWLGQGYSELELIESTTIEEVRIEARPSHPE